MAMRQQGGPPMDDLSLQEEQQKSQSFAEEFEEEGHEVDENEFRDQSSATTQGNDSDIVAGSAADDGDGPSAAVIGGGSPCQTRRNKLVTVLAGAALVVIVALTAGLVPYFNNKGKGDDGSAQLIVAMASDGSEEVEVETYYPTYSPTPAPILPMAGAVSNDFGAGDGSDGSNDSVNGRIRRRRQ